MISSPPPSGLAALTDEHLKHALRLLTKGQLVCPFKRSDLLLRGLNPLAEHGDLLFGLEERAVRSALIIALNERREATAREAKLRVVIDRLYEQIDELGAEVGRGDRDA